MMNRWASPTCMWTKSSEGLCLPRGAGIEAGLQVRRPRKSRLMFWPWGRWLSSCVTCGCRNDQYAARCMCNDPYYALHHHVLMHMSVMVLCSTNLCICLLCRLMRRARSSRIDVFATPWHHVECSTWSSTMDAVSD